MSERSYEIRLPSGEVKSFTGTLEDAIIEARNWVEHYGWMHERIYAKQPKEGAAWATPNGQSVIMLRPTV